MNDERQPSRTAEAIAAAIAFGPIALSLLTYHQYRLFANLEPSPAEVKAANLLTGAAMALAFASVLLSERLWRSLVRSGAPLETAFIVRAACREAAAILGCVAALRAAQTGVLRVYPAYWVDLVPAGLLLAFLAAHWPTAARLAAEADEARQ